MINIAARLPFGSIWNDPSARLEFLIERVSKKICRRLRWNARKRWLNKYAKELRADPITVVDVGAAGGVENEFIRFGKSAKVFGFEPDQEECQRLNLEARTRNVFLHEEYFPVAIGRKPETLPLFLSENKVASSLLATNGCFANRFPQGEMARVIGSTPIQLVDLDSALKTRDIASVDYLKIDVEGASLEVLDGFREFLAERPPLVISIEAFLHPYHDGEATFAKVQDYLARFNLHFFGFQHIERWPRYIYAKQQRCQLYGVGQAIWTQALFLYDPLFPGARSPEDRYKIDYGRMRKAQFLASFFGFEDFALELQTMLRVSPPAPVRSEANQ